MSRPSSSHRERLEVFARRMRLAPTVSEARLWQALRGSRLGVAFRRQVVVEGFIVDFLAPAVHVVVEVDGGYDSRRAKADARRERVLARTGYRGVRVAEEEVMSDLGKALDRIRRELE